MPAEETTEDPGSARPDGQVRTKRQTNSVSRRDLSRCVRPSVPFKENAAEGEGLLHALRYEHTAFSQPLLGVVDARIQIAETGGGLLPGFPIEPRENLAE